MNVNWQRLITGVLLSFVPLLSFGVFVYGAQLYLNHPAKETLLGGISEAPVVGGDYISGISEEEMKIESGEMINNSGVESDQTKIIANAAISVETDLITDKEIIFESNINSELPIASLTKLMTAIIVFDNYDLSKDIIISQKADSQLPMKTDLKVGDSFPIEEILHIMLIESSNRAAYALAEQSGEENFVALMNKKSQDLGLKNTFFADPTGLSPHNVSSVNDLVILVKYILTNYPKIAEISTIENYELVNFGKVSNTNQLLSEFPNIALSKTGYTNFANGCLISVLSNSENNNYFINIILGANDRFSEMRKLINWKNIIDDSNKK
jgi:D-alanyl-D-alanine carboxypeptidase (penicillin-binding protein 5/6)